MPRLLADAMLGRLARWLRALGLDVVYDPDLDDPQLLELAAGEGRVLLTRDRRLVRRRRPPVHLLVRSERLADQLVQTITELEIPLRRESFFSRCLRCNALLEPLPAEVAKTRVPARVVLTHQRFHVCPGCGRVYWRAGHVRRMLVRLDEMLSTAGIAPWAGDRPEIRPSSHRPANETMHSMTSIETPESSTPELGERLDRALALASELHRNRLRQKTRIPYLAHLMAVSALVLENGGDEDEAIAALLHDGPEDCGGRPVLERIRREFGDRVATIVEGCTDSLEEPRPAWRARKESYLRHLAAAPPEVQRVSCSDKVHNLSSITEEYRRVGAAIWDRFAAGRDGALWYYRSLLEAFVAASAPGCERLIDRLARTLAELERLIARSEADMGLEGVEP